VAEFSTRNELESHQLERLRELLERLVPANRFYADRLTAAGLDSAVKSLEEFRQRMPFTDKEALVEDQRQNPPYGTNLTFPLERYVRLHRTSGTSGAHLRWLDTAEDWSWMVDGWCQVLRGAGVDSSDRVMVAFSFGPFIGLWLAFEAAARIGCLCLSGGGLSSSTRLQMILANGATVLCATPTYAIRLGETAREEGVDLARSDVTRIIVGGEPGGSVPATRARIEELWPGARVFDHYGMSEAGPVTYQTPISSDYVHVIESHYLCEIVDPKTGEPLASTAEEPGELVLTTLGRAGAPLLRYRTRDLVRRCEPQPEDPDPVTTKLRGGVLGRRDDMIIVRGVNLYPSAVDQIIRSVPEIAEYRVEIREERGLTELVVKIEPESARMDTDDLCRRLSEGFRRAYNLRVPVIAVGRHELPRFELKAKRWVRI
jgi:phenylacetate-CoA ligase